MGNLILEISRAGKQNAKTVDKTTNKPYNVNKMTETSLISQLLATTNAYLGHEDQRLIERALAFSQQSHKGFQRLDGHSYLTHSLAVAQIAASWSAPAHIVAGSLLHDILKERYSHYPSLELINERFGQEIAHLVADVRQLGRFAPMHNKLAAEEPTRKGIDLINQRLPWAALILQRNPMAVVIKIADRLHNLKSTHVLDNERRENFAAASLNIFASFADRLGMRAAKRELEDRAFQILQPDEYRAIGERYQETLEKGEAYAWLAEARECLQKTGGITAVTLENVSLYTLYRGEIEQKRPTPPHLARPLLILTENEAACYQALGAAHQQWSPRPSEFYDYIASAKPNGYRALHTRVNYKAGHSLLVIICDRIMRQVAEEGVIAGWRGVEKKYLPYLPDWQQPPSGKIAVLTPNGDLKHLPHNATPIDFAYAVHQDLGHQCIGAVVNGRSYPLDAALQNGYVVKILTSRAGVGPSASWLDSVQTRKAKQMIRRWFNAQKPSEMMERGWQLLDKRLREEGSTLSLPQTANSLEQIARQLGYASRNELLVAIGVGQRQPAAIAAQMKRVTQQKEGTNRLQATMVALHDNHLPRRLAQCCNPKPPDLIVAYTTRKDEIVIHRANCGHVYRLHPLSEAKWDTIAWQRADELRITALDRVALVRDVSGVIAEMGIGMISFHADQISDGSAKIEIGMGNVTETAVDLLIQRLHKVADVRQVERARSDSARGHSFQAILAKDMNNPYTLRAVSGDRFYGRKQELQELVDNLRFLRPGEAALIWGPRRIGKTSLLLQFEQVILAGENYAPALIDLHEISGQSVAAFLHIVAKKIALKLSDPRIPVPNYRKLAPQPLAYFRSFLENIRRFNQSHLVLILDEFQILTGLREGNDSLSSVFDYFRSLIQQGQGINLVFSGWGSLSSIRQIEGASSMLNVTRSQRVGCLKPPEAVELITAPVAQVNYDPDVVQALLKTTGGHPYFIQLLCGELILRVNRTKKDDIESADLDYVLSDWLPKQAEHHFNHFWGAYSGMDNAAQLWHKLALTAVATVAPDNRAVSFEDVARQAAAHGLTAVRSENELWHALERLVEMDTLAKTEDNYYVKVGACDSWLRANYSVPYIIKEMQ